MITKTLGGVALVATVVLLSACNPMFGELDGDVRHGSVNALGLPSGVETFDYVRDGDQVTASAPTTNRHGNLREVFWDDTGPFIADQHTCVTFEDTARSAGPPWIQPGIALRIAPSGENGEGIKAITIQQNIWSDATWILWLHTWDSSEDPHDAFTAMYGIQDIVGMEDAAPPPWHLCAQTYGTYLRFKLWTDAEEEPSWSDTTRSFQIGLPPEWDYAGYSGAYVAHLRAGQKATFSNLVATPLCLGPDGPDLEVCDDVLAQIEAHEAGTP